MAKQQMFYNGVDIMMEDCKYKIKGYPMVFYTIESVKNHIDLMKNNQTQQTPVYINHH